MIKLLIGGSPCTKWSIAQKRDREVTASGEGWELFLNYKTAKDKFNPDFFLYENNKSAAQAIKDQISMELGVPLMHINSALVSAQNRQRFYAFNWTVPQPEDRGIFLKDILESGCVDKDKAYCLKHQVGNSRDYFKKHHTQVAFEPVGVGYRNRRNEDGKLTRRFETDGDAKANALTTVYTDSMVAEPIRVGGLPRPNGEISTSQAMRIYSDEGKSTTLSANGGGLGGKTGLYAIPVNETKDGKSQCIRATCYKDGIRNMVGNDVDKRTCVAEPVRVANIGNGSQGDRIYDANGKSCAIKAQSGGAGGNGQGLYATPTEETEVGGTIYEVKDGLIEIKGQKYKIKLPDGFYIIRKLSVTECCRLQTLPDDYCRAVSASRAYTGLGGGWTAEVIIHILQGALKDVPRDEAIIVLSMYDGIGTGRYCLEQMGFTNIKYYAYEIDPYAIKISASNYPDIIQLGNAFDLRNEDWHLPEQEETMDKCDTCKHNTNDYVCKPECGGCDGESHFEEKSQKYISMDEVRAAEILDPTHREQYDDIEEVNEACRMGMVALIQEKNNTARAIKFYSDPFSGKQFTTCSVCDGKISNKDNYCKHCGRMITGEVQK